MRDNSYLDKSGKCICRICRISKFRTRAEKYETTGKYIYRDEFGRKWNRKCCPDCIRINIHRLGINKYRHELTDHKNSKGFNAEKLVSNYFLMQEYRVTQTHAHGPDLIIEKGDVIKTCEVKSITPYKVNGKTFYFCSPIYPKRRNDDLIAFVMPDDSLIIENMKDHLMKCAKSGRRSFTKEVRILQGECYQSNRGPKRFQFNPLAKT
jgi:hypothetical protein